MSRDATLGRYRLLKLIGRGGMGEVHLASAHGVAGFEKLVALKVLSEQDREDNARRESLWREAHVGARLDHEGIVQVLDLGEEAGSYYVAFEYVRGHSLGRVLDYLDRHGQPYDIRSAVHVARVMLGALVYVHGRAGRDGAPLGLVHGDVSPSNVLLGADGRIKLSDFGMAAFAGETALRGKLAGKLAFLPYEAFHGASRTQEWDVYAAALTLYQAIAGRPAFKGESLREIRRAVRQGAPPLDELRSDCPPALAEVVARGMAGERERFSRALEFRRALDEVFPRRVDDAEHHAAYIAEIYRREAFVAENGELPSSRSATGTHSRLLEDSEMLSTSRPRLRPLRFGISPAHGASMARERGARLTDQLAERLEREVRVVPFADYASLGDCLVQGEVDFAWMPPAAFVHAAERGAGLVAVARRRGRPTFESALIVHRDAHIRELEDLRGRTVAWVDRESASGYLFVAAELARRLGHPEEVFAKEHFHGSHRAVCEAIANRWADAGATYVVQGERGALAQSGWHELLADGADLVEPLLFAGPIPGDNIAHRPNLPAKLVDRLVAVWTSLGDDEQGRALLDEIFHAEALVREELDLYQGMRAAMEAVCPRVTR